MNASEQYQSHFPELLAMAAALSITLAGCAALPQPAPGAAEVRSKLNELQANTSLAEQVPVEIREAEAAVRAAEEPMGKDVALAEHRVYIADRQVEIARATAATRYAEDQREELGRVRDAARLAARTQEADSARRSAALAADDAAAAAAEMQRQIDALQAEATDRGLVLTLSNVLFATGGAELQSGATRSLDKLVRFLNDNPDRSVLIEGHTDDAGGADMNQALSQRRAQSVKSYLVQQGIYSQRLIASGLGETRPVADNLTQSGRQQNRRVEVIIENPSSATSRYIEGG